MPIRKLRGRPPRAAKYFDRLLPTISAETVAAYSSNYLKFQFAAPFGAVLALSVMSRMTYTIHNGRELYSIDRIVELPTEMTTAFKCPALVICGRHATFNTENYELATQLLDKPDIRSIINSLVQTA